MTQTIDHSSENLDSAAHSLEYVRSAVIKVIGVGGGGCNAINHMLENEITGISYISANTDAQSLSCSKAANKIQLGKQLTRGLGAGSNPEVGRDAANEDREAIEKAIDGADILFIATGMGGGTGTGAAPVIAEIAKAKEILTVGVVTKPFLHEGSKRVKVAEEGIAELRKFVDSLIVVPNEKLKETLGKVSVRQAFRAADNVLSDGVSSISEIIVSSGDINVDFADVKNVMSNTGLAVMGIGEASGKERAREAVEQAVSSPLLDNVSLEGAKGILVNITTAPDSLDMDELGEILAAIDKFSPNADRKFGTVEDKNISDDTLRLTIIATGLQEKSETAIQANRQQNSRNQFNNIMNTPEITSNLSHLPEGLIVSGRNTRSLNVVASDFADQSVQDNFDIPAVLRRQFQEQQSSEE